MRANFKEIKTKTTLRTIRSASLTAVMVSMFLFGLIIGSSQSVHIQDSLSSFNISVQENASKFYTYMTTPTQKKGQTASLDSTDTDSDVEINKDTATSGVSEIVANIDDTYVEEGNEDISGTIPEEPLYEHPHIVSNIEDDKFCASVESYYIQVPENIRQKFEGDGWIVVVVDNLQTTGHIEYGESGVITINHKEAATDAVLKYMGYYIDFAMDQVSNKSSFRDAYDKDYEGFTSNFRNVGDCKDLGDFFAESFSRYITNPNSMQMYCPNVYAWFDERLKEVE